ncbi:hypothetical protein [Streptomyces sp. NPDC058092]|uniref:hypothetical protein n=1 Tax=Streptomyces sp. NPDC058092 TaxID=3346336 RepID=UPI0036EC1CDA
MSNQSAARARLAAMFTFGSDADETEFEQRVQAVIDAETAALRAQVAELNAHPADGSAPAYPSRALPPRNARCSCGHTGLDHHHGDTKCWANLPRTIGPNRVWGPVRICDCAKFEASS